MTSISLIPWSMSFSNIMLVLLFWLKASCLSGLDIMFHSSSEKTWCQEVHHKSELLSLLLLCRPLGEGVPP